MKRSCEAIPSDSRDSRSRNHGDSSAIHAIPCDESLRFCIEATCQNHHDPSHQIANISYEIAMIPRTKITRIARIGARTPGSVPEPPPTPPPHVASEPRKYFPFSFSYFSILHIFLCYIFSILSILFIWIQRRSRAAAAAGRPPAAAGRRPQGSLESAEYQENIRFYKHPAPLRLIFGRGRPGPAEPASRE